MAHNAPTIVRPVRIPPVVWFLGLGLISALVAIFVFSVPLGTVGYYALIAAFIGSHLFMHGSHGGHGGHGGQGRPIEGHERQEPVDGAAGETHSTDEQRHRSGSCH